MTTDNTALAHTTRRLLEDIDDPEGVLSAFQSFPSGGPND